MHEFISHILKVFVHRRKLGRQMYMSFIDGPYLVTLCCLLLPYTTRIHEVELSVCPQMYLKKPGSIAESFEVISNCYESPKSTDSES